MAEVDGVGYHGRGGPRARARGALASRSTGQASDEALAGTLAARVRRA